MSFHHQLRRGLLALPMLCLLIAGFVSIRFAPESERDTWRAEACLRVVPADSGIAG